MLTPCGVQTLFQCVQRAGADVAEYHAQRTENQCRQACAMSMLRFRYRQRRDECALLNSSTCCEAINGSFHDH